jgi:hypothetical protein
MTTSIFDSLSIPVVYLGLCVLLLTGFEIGYQISRHSKVFKEEVEPGTLTPMIGGLIGVLGFLLAFTFPLRPDNLASASNTSLKSPKK